jgi:ribosomal protein L37AE/L43A
MAKLPKEIKLTKHAQQRLRERRNSIIYNTKNLMRSSCKWYGKDDLIPESGLYLHCLYVCRKSNQMGYITDGNIEVIYNKGTGVAITIMEVKEKFLPITQYIKPEYLKQIEIKKEKKKMRKKTELVGVCPDCGKEVTDITSQGICVKCRTRKSNAKSRGREYVPYINLTEEEKRKIDTKQIANSRKHKVEEVVEEIPMPKMPVVENYYEMKATQNVVDQPAPIPVRKPTIPNFDPLSDQTTFINILKECGCTISDESLKETLSVLLATEKLRDAVTTIADNENQDTLLDLEHMMNVVERKLQHDWEYNGFQEADDIKFKGFLTWRRVLKGAIFFWKKLYQTGALIQMKNAWDAYTTDPNEKQLMSGDRINSIQKRFQITTESISTIFNTRKPFTRIFYAVSKEEAYDKFVKWMADRQLHENKSKTTIVELSSEGEDGRDKE